LAVRSPLAGPVPELAFTVLDAARVEYAAAPTLAFSVRIDCLGGHQVRSVLLDTQLQIGARRRHYDESAHERLFELFGPPAAWGSTLRTLLWTRTSIAVPAFTGSTVAELQVPCSYDMEVLASKYLDALSDGEVPLEFLFSGTLFYAGASGQLQAARISWEGDAEYRMPVRVWRETMDHYFPGSAWLRLGKESFDALCAYKARHAIPSWDATVDALLAEER
jgi:hypothetical protein